MVDKGFVLSDEVAPLTFSFKPIVDGPEGEGIVPEPTSDQVQAFRTAIAELLKEELPDEVTEEGADEVTKARALRAMVIEVLGRDQTELQQKVLHVVADLCSDRPSFDVLDGLPYRHQQAFTGWISGIFLLPQTTTPATNG